MENFEVRYLTTLATTRNITKPQAVKLIDKCIATTAEKLSIDYSSVYATIHSMEFMTMCLRGKCSAYDLEKCSQACYCVVFDGKCHPRYFEDAAIMNADPDKYLLGMPTDKLNNIVKLASYLYYNFDGGGLTDNTFDALEYTLNKRLKLRGRRYEKIGAPVIEKLRVTLPYGMPSLDKVKPGSRELMNFIQTSGTTGIVYTPKLDGVSGLAVYKNGVCSELYSRGDGTIGGNLTYLKEYLAAELLPKITDPRYKNIVVRGEFIITKETWNKYKDTYSNARSFVSAKINSGSAPVTGITDLLFIVYSMIDSGNPKISLGTPQENLAIVRSLGFLVVDSGILVSPPVFDIISLYKKMRQESVYNIDGLVLSHNVVPVDGTVGTGTADKKVTNPRTTVAFKMRLEEQMRMTRVLDVEWNVSRYGRMVPVAIYESVYVDGVRLHRASAFNAAHVRDWSLGKGTEIKVIRSGDVIPTILDVVADSKIPPIYPHPIAPGALGVDKGWRWSDSGKDLVVNDIENNRVVQLKRSEHFFVTIGVPRLREKTLEKLWNAGIRSIKAITNAPSSEFIKIKGIGKKTADALYRDIHTVMRSTRLDRYIPASTTLQLGIGRKLIKQLLNYHPTLMEDSPEVLLVMLTKKEIPGIGPKRIGNIVENITKFKQFLYELNRGDIDFAIKHDSDRIKKIATRGYNPKIRGKTFVFTGFFGKIDYDLEDYIYDNFGSLGTHTNQSTQVVVSANLMDITSKMLTAEKLGIKVLSIEEFTKAYDIPYTKTKVTFGDTEGESGIIEIEDADTL